MNMKTQSKVERNWKKIAAWIAAISSVLIVALGIGWIFTSCNSEEQLTAVPTTEADTPSTVMPTVMPNTVATQPTITVMAQTSVISTTEQVKALTGVDVQRIGSEEAAWTWRAVPEASTPATCPQGFICTWDIGGETVVFVGPAKSGIVAGTWRHIDSYPDGDTVHNACQLLRKEMEFGLSETPQFNVSAGNFNCNE